MARVEKKPLVLIDGSSYLFRAFHALPPLMNSKGNPTGAIYGVISMLKKILVDDKPDHVVVVFDAKGKTFRDDLYPAYKAHRPPIDPALSTQIEPLFDVIRALGFPLLAIEGVEADDVIATLAERAAKHQMSVCISTGDKDMTQLVNEHIKCVNTMSGQLLDRKGVIEKFGVTPEQIVDYLTLVGDSSDNIPGVSGVGPKTAVKFLQTYGTLDKLVAHADEVKGKVGENLRQAIPTLPLTKTLVTLKRDVPLTLTLADLKLKKPDEKKLIHYFSELEFTKWLNELRGTPTKTKVDGIQYETILDETALQKWIALLKLAKIFAFDTETTSLNYMDAKLVGLSFAIATGQAAYLPLGHADAPQQLETASVLAQLKPLLEDPHLQKIGQNIKYDLEIMANVDIALNGIAFDTMLESYVLDSQSRLDMDSLALRYLDKKTISYEDVVGSGVKQKNFKDVSIEEATRYAAEDADVTWQLHHIFWPLLAKEKLLQSVFTEIEMPLIPVLARMERTGVLIDSAKLKAQSHELAHTLTDLERQAFKLAGREFNLGSPKQLQEILYDELKIPVIKKTPTGQPSTAEPILQELALDYPLPKVILSYRSLSKLKSTYTDVLPEQINTTTGRVHTSYNQTGTATGRLSSSDPNLQNIPVRTEEGRRIRQAFIAPKGFCLLAADYSQIELRIMAHLSEDHGLLAAFEAGLDVHKATAAEVFGVSLAEVTAEQRRSAKAINFGLMYGMSAFGLAKQLDIERNAAQLYIDKYFARYPGVRQYMETTVKRVREKGYVETLMGRRLYLPDINSRDVQRQKGAERAAINAPLQGTAADLIKCAMIRVDEWLLQTKTQARMIMQVHDELVLEVKRENVDAVKQKVVQLMTHSIMLRVPLLVDVGVGDNWDEAH